MFGKGVFQEEENLLRDIVRSVDKRIDYSAKEADGTKFSIHVKLRNHEGEIILDLEDLKAAKTDMIRRHQIRPKIKARCEHLDKSRYGDDVLGLKPAKQWFRPWRATQIDLPHRFCQRSLKIRRP